MRLAVSLAAFLAMTLTAHADTAAGLKSLDDGNVPDAAKQFQAAWDAGDADGAFYLGRLFELGVGTQVDMQRAAQLYAVGSAAGSAKAKNRFGLMHINGEVVLKDFEKGTQLVCEAAEAGDANAQFNCGVSYADGLGVTVDKTKAREWWQRAADQDQVAAINFLGRALLEQEQPDAAAALIQFERTAAMGNPMGFYEAAQLYATAPAGVTVDLVKAYAYANLAAARLHPQAAALRDKLEGDLTPEQITAAQTMSRDWKSTAPDMEQPGLTPSAASVPDNTDNGAAPGTVTTPPSN